MIECKQFQVLKKKKRNISKCIYAILDGQQQSFELRDTSPIGERVLAGSLAFHNRSSLERKKKKFFGNNTNAEE